MGKFSLKYAATDLVFSDYYVSEEIQRNSIECFNGCLEFLGILSACYVVKGLPHLNAKSCNYCLSSIEYAHVPGYLHNNFFVTCDCLVLLLRQLYPFKGCHVVISSPVIQHSVASTSFDAGLLVTLIIA